MTSLCEALSSDFVLSLADLRVLAATLGRVVWLVSCLADGLAGWLSWNSVIYVCYVSSMILSIQQYDLASEHWFDMKMVRKYCQMQYSLRLQVCI